MAIRTRSGRSSLFATTIWKNLRFGMAGVLEANSSRPMLPVFGSRKTFTKFSSRAPFRKLDSIPASRSSKNYFPKLSNLYDEGQYVVGSYI